ncbi:MAG: TatD family hydrolase [Candidatus Cryptobacteroides sp.]
MAFVDTHTHLYDEAFASDADLAVSRAWEAGVKSLIFPDIDGSTRDRMLRLASRHRDKVHIALGLHPTSVDGNWRDDIDAVERLLETEDAVAIGETGLDFWWSREYEAQQLESFRAQLELALQTGLPVIVHSREATEATLKAVGEFRGRGLTGVFHAFSGSLETFREIGRLDGWYVGIGGVLTFKNASIATTVKDIPLERIVLETDSPYLTPVPHRGGRNESAYIPLVAARLAQIKGIDISRVEEVTTLNAKRLFGI